MLLSVNNKVIKQLKSSMNGDADTDPDARCGQGLRLHIFGNAHCKEVNRTKIANQQYIHTL